MTTRPALFHDFAPDITPFRDAVLHGLAATAKRIPCKYFYDETGSQLFERICTLPEYYPTRTELALLKAHRDDLAELAGPDCRLVDFGAGSSLKARLLLSALDKPQAYLPVDISREHLLRSAGAIAHDYPGLQVIALCADYTRRFRLPEKIGGRRSVGFFPGSTIGNFTPSNARRFLKMAAAVLEDGPIIVGVDLKKSAAVLNAAYDDSAGVTAAFNLNLLVRINRELGGTFRTDRFRHRAFYNADRGRVEMHLESLDDQVAKVDGERFAFRAGETIHTENSYKFTPEEFRGLANAAGFQVSHAWLDAARLFSIFYLGH